MFIPVFLEQKFDGERTESARGIERERGIISGPGAGSGPGGSGGAGRGQLAPAKRNGCVKGDPRAINPLRIEVVKRTRSRGRRPPLPQEARSEDGAGRKLKINRRDVAWAGRGRG